MALAAPVATLAPAAPAQDGGPVSPFVGTYVGTAEVYDAEGALEERRDMDIVITDEPRGGFTVRWINVTLVDGRRDVPGVERRVDEVRFVEGEAPGVYVQETRGSLFERRRAIEPIEGDPMVWARIDGDSLGVFNFVIAGDGRYALQSYERILTDVGIDIVFRAIVEGEVVRRIEGHTVRVD
ncbi:MAG: hypothetical protein RID91_21540 [Azospirillaceae bacterium]